MVVLLQIFLVLLGNAFPYEIDRSVLDNSTVSFIPHTTPRPFGRYLSYEIKYSPVKELLETLKLTTGPLSDRGEAHITVITPPEFDYVLGKVLTIDEINEVALSENIQASTFHPVCIGTGSHLQKTTYYVVVKSPDLLRIRRAVYDLYLAKKGDPEAFDPEKFYPHITLGYIVDDVHESDGLYKDENTCIPGAEVSVR